MNGGKNQSGIATVEKVAVKTPRMYCVFLVNDDFTPMDFVVQVLEDFFSKSRYEATQIMLDVHRTGRGLCGKYPKDIAVTKVGEVISYARSNEYPLACIWEPEESKDA